VASGAVVNFGTLPSGRLNQPQLRQPRPLRLPKAVENFGATKQETSFDISSRN
jgi:hypothetical protein